MKLGLHFFIFFILLGFVHGQGFQLTLYDDEAECTPSPTPFSAQYIIGYGSLMSSASKNRTYPNTGPNIPIILSGFTRSWNCKGVAPTLSTTYLGTSPSPEGSFNAVIFSLDNSPSNSSSGSEAEKALQDFDNRESFYCRKEVRASQIKILATNESSFSHSDNANISSQYWIYITKSEFTEEPSKTYPIVQSYVDTWLTGCLEMEKTFGLSGFAKDCLFGTEGWSEHWVNDRIYPRRPYLFQPNAAAIDKLLREIVPEQFDLIDKSSGSGNVIVQWGLSLLPVVVLGMTTNILVYSL